MRGRTFKPGVSMSSSPSATRRSQRLLRRPCAPPPECSEPVIIKEEESSTSSSSSSSSSSTDSTSDSESEMEVKSERQHVSVSGSLPTSPVKRKDPNISIVAKNHCIFCLRRKNTLSTHFESSSAPVQNKLDGYELFRRYVGQRTAESLNDILDAVVTEESLLEAEFPTPLLCVKCLAEVQNISKLHRALEIIQLKIVLAIRRIRGAVCLSSNQEVTTERILYEMEILGECGNESSASKVQEMVLNVLDSFQKDFINDTGELVEMNLEYLNQISKLPINKNTNDDGDEEIDLNKELGILLSDTCNFNQESNAEGVQEGFLDTEDALDNEIVEDFPTVLDATLEFSNESAERDKVCSYIESAYGNIHGDASSSSENSAKVNEDNSSSSGTTHENLDREKIVDLVSDKTFDNCIDLRSHYGEDSEKLAELSNQEGAFSRGSVPIAVNCARTAATKNIVVIDVPEKLRHTARAKPLDSFTFARDSNSSFLTIVRHSKNTDLNHGNVNDASSNAEVGAKRKREGSLTQRKKLGDIEDGGLRLEHNSVGSRRKIKKEAPPKKRIRRSRKLRDPNAHKLVSLEVKKKLKRDGKPKPYSCKDCDLHYSRKTSFMSHMEELHQTKVVPKVWLRTFICDVCGFKKDNSGRSAYALAHLQQHETDVKAHKCDDCSGEFTTKQMYELHDCPQVGMVEGWERGKKGKDHPCGHCELVFNSVLKMQNHTKSDHPGKLPFVCSLCIGSFQSYTSLITHMIETHGATKYKCRICPRGEAEFTTYNGSLRHYNLKHLGKSYQCSDCGKEFYDKTYFRNHMQGHSTSKDFVCAECGAAFKKAFLLCIHEKRMHDPTGKKYLCQYCDKQFFERGNLMKHIRKVHEDGRKQC